jgi:hypothetical protein
VKRTGHRRSKLDRHDFTGIFIGYSASDNNIIYINLDSGLVKTSHHAQFDEAWYLQDSPPPAAQLLYNLGLEVNDNPIPDSDPPTVYDPAPFPPLVSKHAPDNSWKVPQCCPHLPLPLRCTLEPNSIAAKAAWTMAGLSTLPPRYLQAMATASMIVDEYRIGRDAMEMIYMSPDPYHDSFDKLLDLC